MTLRTVTTAIIGLMFAMPALGQADLAQWRGNFGFAPNESLEFVYERTDRPQQVQISNAAGQVIATIDLPADPAAGNSTPPSPGKGFGFVTFTSERGALIVDGMRYGPLDTNPRTRRHLIGFALLGSPPAPGAAPNVASLTVVGPSGESRHVFVKSWSTSGAGLD